MKEATNHHIKVEQFEGPLDLLLQLIESKELDISTISLAEVTGQYVLFIDNLKEVSQEDLVSFLEVASKLILIKSKALLPVLEEKEEVIPDVEDLARRLKEYKVIKMLSKNIDDLVKERRISFSRMSDKRIKPVFFMPRNVTLKVLHRYYDKIFKETFSKSNVLPEKEIKEIVKLEDRIEELQKKITKSKMNFGSLFSNKSSRVEMIVSFLAMLHLLKRRVVVAKQKDLFGDIELSHNV